MAEPFKNLFNRAFYNEFCTLLEIYVPSFDQSSFMKDIFDDSWEEKELKERARHTTLVLKKHLPGSFNKDVEIILDIIEHIQNSDSMKAGIESMFFPDYIEVFGIDHFDRSMQAMEKITQYFSCEFAIRPFILKYPEKAIAFMREWSRHPNPNVRRLSSEGCRPRLPWAMALPFLKKDASPILPILEQLKNDESETVRRSVANNLNDIAKDNPDLVLKLVKKWKGKSKNTDWVLKHGSRTLLKQAHPEALELFGYGSREKINVRDFYLLTAKVKMGDALEFSFRIRNEANEPLLIRLEYAMYFLKANGSHSKKVFKISERDYKAGEEKNIFRKQSFRAITTRRYYPGIHKVSLVLNGVESELQEFELLDA